MRQEEAIGEEKKRGFLETDFYLEEESSIVRALLRDFLFMSDVHFFF